MLKTFLRILRGKGKQPGSWMDRELVRLSKVDSWTHRDAMNHLAILGAPGSGKTSYVLKLYVTEYMRQGYAMAYFCGKTTDKAMYLDWAAKAGRIRDVIVFEPGGKQALNILAWQQSAAKGQGVAMNVIAMFEIILDLIERSKKGDGGDAYWPRSAMECLRYACILCELSQQPLSTLMLTMIITGAPYRDSQERDNAFWYALKKAEQNAVSQSEKADFRLCENYFKYNFGRLESKTRGIIVAIVSSMLNPFNLSPLRELFGDETSITPEEIYQQRKILIVNISPSEYFELGRIGSIVMKYVLQRALLARNPAVDNIPFCMVCDEYHQFAASYDATFTALCRSQLVSMVSVIQNLPLLYGALGGDQKATNEAESLIGLYGTKIFSQNSCPVTNDWASGLFGKVLTTFANGNTNFGSDEQFSLFDMQRRMGYTAGFSESFECVVQANRFASLRTPGEYAEALIFNSGKRFHSNGKPFLIANFRRQP